MVLEVMPGGQLADTLFANLGHLRAPQLTGEQPYGTERTWNTEVEGLVSLTGRDGSTPFSRMFMNPRCGGGSVLWNELRPAESQRR
jgi:hypothetical protein